MLDLSRVVLDVTKPRDMPSERLSIELSKIENVTGVDVCIEEIEQRIESTTVTITGEGFDFESVKDKVNELGASLQSIDRVTHGEIVD